MKELTVNQYTWDNCPAEYKDPHRQNVSLVVVVKPFIPAVTGIMNRWGTSYAEHGETKDKLDHMLSNIDLDKFRIDAVVYDSLKTTVYYLIEHLPAPDNLKLY